jgi:hypothetical protein
LLEQARRQRGQARTHARTLARSHARTLARSHARTHRYAFRLGDSCEYNLYLNSDDGPRVNTLWYFFSVSNIVPGQARPATVQQPLPCARQASGHCTHALLGKCRSVPLGRIQYHP